MTEGENIFGVYIDNLMKLLYNGKRILCILVSNPKCGAIVLILAVLLWAMGDFFVYSADSDCLTLSLEAWDLGDGCMEVFLVGSEARFCGALAEIGYSEGLSLLSVEKCEPIASGSLTFSESNGRIRLLIDHLRTLTRAGGLSDCL